MSGLLVISGPPGAGKSTVARIVARRTDAAAVVEADAFFAMVQAGPEPWRPEANAQNRVVMEAVAAAAGRFAAGGMPTVLDGVVGPWFAPVLLAGSGLERMDYAVLLPSLATCLARVAGRHGHGFTDLAATEHLHREFAAAEIAPRHLFAGEGGADEIADAIVHAREAGTLEWVRA